MAEQYTVLRMVERGSVSEVYEAQPLGSRGTVALKVLMDVVGRDDPESREQRIAYFLREAAVTAQIVHPNVVRLEEVGFDPEAGLFIALEFMPGERLDRIIEREGPMSGQRAREIVKQMLSALSVAHRQKILHRDLKPSNIQLVNAPGEADSVRLFDFGIAKSLERLPVVRDLTRRGDMVGSPGWMSPEQCRGLPVTAKSDLYSVGAVLFYLLTGKPPFTGTTLFQLLETVLTASPPSVNEARKDLGLPPVSRKLEKAIARALHKDPEQRFVDADHFQSYLVGLAESDWRSIRSSLVHVPADSTSPGLVMVRTHEARDAKLLSRVLTESLDAVRREWAAPCDFVVHGDGKATVFLRTLEGPTLAAMERAALAQDLLRRIEDDGRLGTTSLLVACGDPQLARRGALEQSPLLLHLHALLERSLRSTPPVRYASGGFVRAGRPRPGGVVYAPPEWAQPLRGEFDVVRAGRGAHGVLRVEECADDNHEEEVARALVLAVVGAQATGLALSELEETLFAAGDPLEVLGAISDLQVEEQITIDEAGYAALGEACPTLPPRVLPPNEERLLFLRLFNLMVSEPTRDARAQALVAEYLEAAHQTSAVRHWIHLAELLANADPDDADAALERAFRLSSMRGLGGVARELLDALEARDGRAARDFVR